MSLQKSSKAILVEYKFLKEEKESVDNIHKQGLIDLGYYLNELKGQLSENVVGQIEKFENQFFNKQKDIEEIIEEVQAKATEESPQEDNEPVIKEKWAKSLYREIVLLTHPDKTAAIPIPKIVNKLLGYYNIATDAYSNNKYEDLLFVGNELDIEVPEEKVKEHIAPKIQDMLAEINQKKGSFPYQWQILEEDKRSIILQNYLKSIGYVFEKKVIDEAIERVKRIKRKVGTRPVNYIKQRLKLK